MEAIWKGILNLSSIDSDTDFFKSGAGSMDVTRLVEEVRERCGGVELTPEHVYMGPTFEDFLHIVVTTARSGGAGDAKIEFKEVEIDVNNMRLRFPNQLFINGDFVDSESGRTYPSINPHDESTICQVAKASAADVSKAIEAARHAFYEGDWGEMSARDRGALLFKLADLMEAHKEELATIESLDSGAVYTLALKTHVGMSIDTWRYFAGWCDKIHGSTIPISHARPNRNLTLTRREPLGVCGLVTPWNYPLMMLSWKMAACLAAGNTVVHKPAQVSPLTALKFAELVAMAGIPPGVVNVLPGAGTEVGNAIVMHHDVRKVGFTGSTPIGAQLMQDCGASNIKKCSLELGGKSPLIIMSDADLDKAVRQALSAVFFNKGENCIAAGRVFVAESLHDEFVARVSAEVEKMKIGDPLDRSTHHGPQNHRAHFEKLLDYAARGVKEGATLVAGGGRQGDSGLYFQPTIFTGVTDDMWMAHEESFGPIMIISTFVDEDLDGVLRRANATEYGLASGIFSRDVSKVLRVAEGLEAGTVFVNCYNKTDVAAPFGGFKQSGFGKDLGEEALHEYLKTKTITIEY